MTETTTGSAVELLHAAMFTPEGRRDPYPLLEQLHGHGEHLDTFDVVGDEVHVTVSKTARRSFSSCSLSAGLATAKRTK